MVEVKENRWEQAKRFCLYFAVDVGEINYI